MPPVPNRLALGQIALEADHGQPGSFDVPDSFFTGLQRLVRLGKHSANRNGIV